MTGHSEKQLVQLRNGETVDATWALVAYRIIQRLFDENPLEAKQLALLVDDPTARMPRSLSEKLNAWLSGPYVTSENRLLADFWAIANTSILYGEGGHVSIQEPVSVDDATYPIWVAVATQHPDVVRLRLGEQGWRR